MLDQHQDAPRGAHERQACDTLYRRPMPGGGYVEVELDAVRTPSDDEAGKRGAGAHYLRRDSGRVAHQ